MSEPQPSQARPVNGKPEPRKGRTLILCFDGTGNQFRDDKNTNVVLLFSLLERNKPKEQLVYYQTGIGTTAPPGLISSIGQKVARVLDEAFAWYLQDHVMAGYKFLMDTYEEGDKICIFGYSRGAYTARALAAMLFRVGLLPPRNAEQIPFAYEIFKNSPKEFAIYQKDPTDPRGHHSKNFTNTFSRKVPVEFVGLWDTVASVGLVPETLPNTRTNRIVKHVRHALALDERRVKFKANYWNAPSISRNAIGDDKSGQKGFKSVEQTVEEVWFAGGHGDVGGGWEKYSERSQLARIPFRWMVREAKKCVPTILWNEVGLEKLGVHQPDSNNADAVAKYIEREKLDAVSKFHSAFTDSGRRYLWKILEAIPLVGSVEAWGYRFKFLRRPNWWSARKIKEPTVEQPTKVHSSVRTRQTHLPGGYENAAQWDPQLTTFVDEWALPEDVKKST
ncbi:hypothetical protein FRC04_000758 [Tulasnella sp. 424]|nr:hypothetical protein FRC04_000758 [Tulasnella sp. 424]KAG8969923.1 hypothetical protein FRC05_000774 [Tulasnella sp. 425]